MFFFIHSKSRTPTQFIKLTIRTVALASTVKYESYNEKNGDILKLRRKKEGKVPCKAL